MTSPCSYDSFLLPDDRERCADAQLVLNLAKALRNRLETVPHEPNRLEAIVRLDKAVMVAIGGFNVRPRERRNEDGAGTNGSAPEPGGAPDAK